MDRYIDSRPVQSSNYEASESAFAQYVGICGQQKWMILGCAVGCAAVAGLWSYLQTPVYQSKATIVVERESPNVIEKGRSYYQSDVSPDYFQTQFELMKSRLVLQRTAQAVHLSDQPEYQERPSAVKEMVLSIVPAAILEWADSKKEAGGLSPEEAEDQLLKQFAQNVEITPIRGARLAHIYALSEKPEFAAKIANTLASVYIDRTQEVNAQAREKSAEWLTGHLDELRKKAEAAQQALYEFRVKHGLLGTRDRQTVTAHTNTELDAELVKAEMKRAEAQARIEQIRSVLRDRADKNGAMEIDWSSLDASAEVLSSPLIQTLRAQEIKGSGQVAELMDKYGPLHPKLARAKAELDDLRERIRQEVEKIFDSVKREYDASQVRVRAIKEAAARHKQEKIKLENVEVQYGMLEREAESSQQLFDLFLKQAKEADLSAGIQNANVYVADPAVPSALPARPKKVLNIMLGLLFGLMAGVGYAFLRDSRDQSLKDAVDVERYMGGASVLGVMPVLSKAESQNGQLLLMNRSSTPAAESVRIIRTNVLISKPGELPRCVLVTSPGEGEGKTTLAVSLAAAEAQLEDALVLLINADLRKLNSHNIYSGKSLRDERHGLADYLSGKADVQDIIHGTEVPNLWVIPNGGRPWNPAELLQSKKMAALLKYYLDKGFHIILDTPPVLAVADPLVLSPLVDGVLLVIAAKQTTREACRHALRRLTSTGGKVLGIVVQKGDHKYSPYFYSAYGSYREKG